MLTRTASTSAAFPIKNSLNFEYDYEYLTEEIVAQIKNICQRNGVEGAEHLHRIRLVHRGRKRRSTLSIVNRNSRTTASGT